MSRLRGKRSSRFEEEEEKETTRRGAKSRRASSRDEDDEEEEDESPRSRRSSRRAVEDDDEDDAPKGRSSRKSRRDEDDEDDEPKKGRAKTSGKGWGVVAKKAKEQENNAKNSYNEFWLAEGETAVVQFLDDEPFCVEGHTVKNSKGKYTFVPCQLNTKRHCLLCEDGGEHITGSWKAIFKVADFRGSWDADKKRFKHDKAVEKVYLMGAGLTEQLKAYADKKKKDLTQMVFEITRSGSGKKTTYNIEQAWDDDEDRPMKPIKFKSEIADLEELFAPPTDDEVVEKYI